MEAQVYESSPPLQALEDITQAFGVPFARWTRCGGGWHPVDPVDEQAGSFRSALLDDASQTDAGPPLMRRDRDNRAWIAVPLGWHGADPVVALAKLPDDPDLFIERLAGVLLAKSRSEKERNAERDELLDGYAVKLADSFEELTFLRRLTKHVEYCDASRGLAEVAETVLPVLSDLMAVEGIALFSADHQPECEPRVVGAVAGVGSLSASTCAWRSKVEELAGKAKGTVVLNFKKSIDEDHVNAGVRSLVLVPLAKDGRVYGWLLGVNKRWPPPAGAPSNSLGHDEIGSMEASLLEAAAGLLATHAANVSLFMEREALVVDVIHTLVGLIEAKDPYTCGHSDRVALAARRLAEQMDLPDEECQDIYLAGLLHDIGKVGVADDVLLKPGKLTEEEFNLIKEHPERGYRLLERLAPLKNLMPGVLHHHEAVDGSGYPHGLRGDAIPRQARVLAVADAWDAMTSDRPYRAGMSWEKAEGILSGGAGKQWDADVVSAFFKCRNDMHIIADTWRDHLRQVLGVNKEEPSAKPLAAALGEPVIAATPAVDAGA